MPNPSIALAVVSYAGSINIGTLPSGSRSFIRYARSPQSHERQRPKTCERFGSATPLKAGSQPTGGRDSVITTGDGTVEVCLGASCKRSPLWLRSTETTSAWVPSTTAAHGISEPGNSEATDDTSYGDLLDSSPAHTQRNNASAVRIQKRHPLDGETRMVSTPSSIALWLTSQISGWPSYRRSSRMPR